MNLPPSRVGKGARGLGFSSAFPHDVKSQIPIKLNSFLADRSGRGAEGQEEQNPLPHGYKPPDLSVETKKTIVSRHVVRGTKRQFCQPLLSSMRFPLCASAPLRLCLLLTVK